MRREHSDRLKVRWVAYFADAPTVYADPRAASADDAPTLFDTEAV
jgi:hypothetical protein